jgi:hypothetical protein
MTKIEGQSPRELVFGSGASPQHSERKRKARNLSQLLSSEPASPEQVIPSFLSVIAAVEAAHETSKEPLNLDPREIRFRDDGTAEVSVSNTPSSGLTVVLGSSKYSTPEMFEEAAGSDNGPRECYVLGFMFYEILLGADIFEKQFQDVHQRGELGWLTWHADRAKHAKPISDLISGFPYSLSRLIEGMMTKEVTARTTDLKKVSQAIAGSLQATQVYRGSSGLRAGDESFAQGRAQSWKTGVLRRWLGLSSRGGLWKALLSRLFPANDKARPYGARARESRERFSRIEADPDHAAKTSVHPLDKSKRGPERGRAN